MCNTKIPKYLYGESLQKSEKGATKYHRKDGLRGRQVLSRPSLYVAIWRLSSSTSPKVLRSKLEGKFVNSKYILVLHISNNSLERGNFFSWNQKCVLFLNSRYFSNLCAVSSISPYQIGTSRTKQRVYCKSLRKKFDISKCNKCLGAKAPVLIHGSNSWKLNMNQFYGKLKKMSTATSEINFTEKCLERHNSVESVNSSNDEYEQELNKVSFTI